MVGHSRMASTLCSNESSLSTTSPLNSFISFTNGVNIWSLHSWNHCGAFDDTGPPLVGWRGIITAFVTE